MPEPRPVTTDASVPHSAAISTPAAVVPPTLRSPSSTRSVPESASSSASAMPVRNACSASSAVSASSMSIRPEPRRTRCAVTSSGSSSGSQSSAMSTTRTPAPYWRASTFTGRGALDRRPHQRARGARGAGRDAERGDAVVGGEQQQPRPGRSAAPAARPCTAASQSASSATFPSPPAGRTSPCQRSCESRRTPASGRSTREPKSSNSIPLTRRTVPPWQAALRGSPGCPPLAAAAPWRGLRVIAPCGGPLAAAHRGGCRASSSGRRWRQPALRLTAGFRRGASRRCGGLCRGPRWWAAPRFLPPRRWDVRRCRAAFGQGAAAVAGHRGPGAAASSPRGQRRGCGGRRREEDVFGLGGQRSVEAAEFVAEAAAGGGGGDHAGADLVGDGDDRAPGGAPGRGERVHLGADLACRRRAATRRRPRRRPVHRRR